LVVGCLLWILTKGTWQNGHSIFSLAIVLEPVEGAFIGLPHCPAMEQSLDTME
jgi:hypothetical protein